MPKRPTDKDGQRVWDAVRDACIDDVNAQYGITERDTGFSIGASLDSDEGQALAAAGAMVDREYADIVVHVDEDKRVMQQPTRKLSPELMAAWLEFHPTWVADRMPAVVADAIHALRTEKRDRRADIRTGRVRVMVNGKRRSTRIRGPLPAIAISKSVAKWAILKKSCNALI